MISVAADDATINKTPAAIKPIWMGKKEVTWDVKARKDGNVITALATTKFPFSDFNIPVLNIAGFVSVQDDVTLQVQIVAQAS